MTSGSPRHGRRAGPIAAVALCAVALAACATGQTGNTPLPTWPVPPELLPPATSATGDARVTCGETSFPAAGLEAAPGAEKASGPEFDALRATIARFASEFPGSSTWTWRLASRDAARAVFMAHVDPVDGRWVSVEVTAGASGWESSGMGDCDPHVVLSAELGPASWSLDPASAPPTPDSTELHILVWERSCSSGRPTTGRMSAPLIETTAATVTMTIGVRPLDGMQTCPMPPGTPAIVRLPEPLGARTLLDGGRVPPAPPSPGNG